MSDSDSPSADATARSDSYPDESDYADEFHDAPDDDDDKLVDPTTLPCFCRPRVWGNRVYPELHRVFLSFVLLALVGIFVWEGASVGHHRNRVFDNNGSEYATETNVVTSDVIFYCEFAAVIGLGMAMAFAWHIFHWSAVSRHALNTLTLAAFATQCVAAGHFFKQLQADRPMQAYPDGHYGGLSSDIVSAGAASVAAAGAIAIAFCLIQYFSALFHPADTTRICGASGCCADACFSERCCSLDIVCSAGRWSVSLLALTYFAVVAVRAAVAGNIVNLVVAGKPIATDVIHNYVALQMLVVTIATSGVGLGVSMGMLLHALAFWNWSSRTLVVSFGLLAFATEIWTLGYSSKFWDRGFINTIDRRWNTIAALTAVAVAVLSLLISAGLAVISNFRWHDVPRGMVYSGGCVARCCGLCGKGAAKSMLVLASLFVFLMYAARFSVNASIRQAAYSGTAARGNKVSSFLEDFSFLAIGLGGALVVVGMFFHMWFWSRISGMFYSVGVLVAFGMDSAAFAFAIKQQAVGGSLDDRYVSLAALCIAQAPLTFLVALISLAASCGFVRGDFATAHVPPEAKRKVRVRVSKKESSEEQATPSDKKAESSEEQATPSDSGYSGDESDSLSA